MAKRRKLAQPGGSRAKPLSRKPLRAAAVGSAPSGAKASSNPQQKKKKQPSQQHQNQRPVIPFSDDDAILLVGEGDLSFARSLVEHHGCTNVTATVLEKDLAELTDKYPHVPDNVAAVEAGGSRVVFGVDARTMSALKQKKQQQRPAGAGAGATKPRDTKDRILFNFPHVGGKSTDVNRQVRYNQELLVDFFKRAASPSVLAPNGSIVVTLFEGEPYTLWNIRDLARHAGLQVERSFVFRAEAYPGYHHARTIGAIRNKQGELTGGGWRGEQRPARSYVFFRKGEVPVQPVSGKKKKRKRSEDDESSDDDEEEEGGQNDLGGGDEEASDKPSDDEETGNNEVEGDSAESDPETR